MRNGTLASQGVEMARPFQLSALDESPVCEVEIMASAAELEALTHRYGLVSVDSLSARMTVRADAAGDIVVTGRLQADVVQECVVTLEPVANAIDAPFDQHYTRRRQTLAADLVVGPEDAQPPELVEGDTIDLGELVAQYLSLSLDPYPRAPGADWRPAPPEADAPVPEGPFAILANLRGREPD